MRKQVVGQDRVKPSHKTPPEGWLDLDALAGVEITSEDPSFPIENALTLGDNSSAGWRAGATGLQTISIKFDQPQSIHRIYLRFIETKDERSQEFLLSYTLQGNTRREIVRQQWTFSPGGSSEEIENYLVDLEGVITVELTIDADRGRNLTPATLAELRIA